MEICILIIVFLTVMWFVARRNPCPRCGKRMESLYNPENGMSYHECPECGYVEIAGTDRDKFKNE